MTYLFHQLALVTEKDYSLIYLMLFSLTYEAQTYYM